MLEVWEIPAVPGVQEVSAMPKVQDIPFLPEVSLVLEQDVCETQPLCFDGDMSQFPNFFASTMEQAILKQTLLLVCLCNSGERLWVGEWPWQIEGILY